EATRGQRKDATPRGLQVDCAILADLALRFVGAIMLLHSPPQTVAHVCMIAPYQPKTSSRMPCRRTSLRGDFSIIRWHPFLKFILIGTPLLAVGGGGKHVNSVQFTHPNHITPLKGLHGSSAGQRRITRTTTGVRCEEEPDNLTIEAGGL